MSTLDSGWILVAGLALFVAWFGWTLLRSRPGARKPDEPPAGDAARDGASVVNRPVVLEGSPEPAAEPSPVPTDERVAGPTAVSPDVPAAVAGALPAAAPLAVPTAPPADAAARLAPPAPAPTPMRPLPTSRSRPPALRVERVLAVEPASGDPESGTTVAILSAQSAPALAAFVAALRRGAEDRAAATLPVAVRLPAGAAMDIARYDPDRLRALAVANEERCAAPPHWLDSMAAAELAGLVLAAQAGARHLVPLVDEVQDLKATRAALPPKAAGGYEARLKSLLQDLTRYARDARDGYAGLIGKAPFRDRVDEAAARAAALWRELVAADAATRRELETLGATPRFGEVQVETARALLQSQRQSQRVQAIVGRAVAALAVLRLLLGRSAEAMGPELDSAAASLHEAIASDGLLRQRLQAAEAGARGDPYVGRGEFEANRAALRNLLEGFGSDLVGARERVAAAQSALREGFPGAVADDWLCVLVGAEGGEELRIAPLRRPGSERAESGPT